MFSQLFIEKFSLVLSAINPLHIENVVSDLMALKVKGGRLFILGMGGSAANASHAVNDFRKLCNIDAFAPTDNVAEFTARANDDGWDNVLVSYLKGAKLRVKDMLLILSVGGGNLENNISVNLIRAVEYAYQKQIEIVSIVGRNGGEVAKFSDKFILVPHLPDDLLVTPITESMQSVVLHLLVSHPLLASNKTKW